MDTKNLVLHVCDVPGGDGVTLYIFVSELHSVVRSRFLDRGISASALENDLTGGLPTAHNKQ